MARAGAVPVISASRRVVRRMGKGTIVLPILGMAFIFSLSQIPGGEKEVLGYSFELSPKVGNFLHLPAYYILAALWKIAFDVRGVSPAKGSALAVLYAGLFGALDELHQYFVPERYMDVRDVIANFLGALLLAATWRFVRPLFFEREVVGPAPRRD